MKISLITIGHKMPGWVDQAYLNYSQRLNRDCQLELKAVAAIKRSKNSDLSKIKNLESQKLIDLVEKNNHIVALEVKGKPWSTEELSRQLKSWLQNGRNISLLVGGPEGMNNHCREKADQLWSLSPLTLPHPMIRIIIAEQIYRAWSILNNHPYHRE